MAAFSALSLPATMAGSKIELLFTADAEVGVVLTRLRHKEGGNFDHVTTLDDTALAADINGRLWQIEGRVRGSATTVIVDPSMARVFEAYDGAEVYGGDTVYSFNWHDVAVPGSNDTLHVRLICKLAAAADQTVQWSVQVSRSRGESFAIEKVLAPILWIKAPTEPRGAETHYVGSKRARLLIPQITIGMNTLFCQNGSPYAMSHHGVQTELTHPGEQPLQLWAICSGNDQGASYRRTIFGHGMDTVGFHKSFRYRGYVSGDQTYTRISFVHWPSFAKQTAIPIENDLPPESEYGNTYTSRYAVAVGALTALTDAYWYDVCEHYREWLRGADASLTPIATDVRKSFLQKVGSFWGGYIQVGGSTHFEPEDLYPRFLEIHRAWLHELDNPYVSTVPNILHLQTTVTGPTSHIVQNPWPPIADSLDPNIGPMAAEAVELGALTTAYTIPGYLINVHAWSSQGLLADMIRYDKDGQPTEYASGVSLVNFAANKDGRISQFLISELYQPVVAIGGLKGIYLDVLTGTGSIPTYSSGSGDYSHSLKHGSADWVIGRRRFLTDLRDTFGPDFPLMSEQYEEFSSHLLDLHQDGYNWINGHLALAESAIYNPAVYTGIADLTIDDYPLAMRDMTPPLWHAVMHEWSPGRRFSIQPSAAPLAGHPAFHGVTGGLTAVELADAHCMTLACNYVSGCQPVFLDYNAGYDYPLIPRDPALDPDDSAGVIFGFLRTLFQSLKPAYAGQFLLHGKMLRPVQVDPEEAEVTKQVNPIAACRLANDALYITYPFFYYNDLLFFPADWTTRAGWSFGSLDSYSVPKVLSSVWQAADDTIGLVLVNWSSDAAATWLGTIDPAHYGFDDFEVSEVAIATGALTSLGTPSGEFTIGNDGTPDVDLSTLPARSVRVFHLVGT